MNSSAKALARFPVLCPDKANVTLCLTYPFSAQNADNEVPFLTNSARTSLRSSGDGLCMFHLDMMFHLVSYATLSNMQH